MSNLYSGIFYSSFQSLYSNILGVIFFLFLIKSLPVVEVGIFNGVNIISGAIVVIAVFALPTIVSKTLAKLLSNHEEYNAYVLVRKSLLVLSVTGIIGSISLIMFPDFFSETLFQTKEYHFIIT